MEPTDKEEYIPGTCNIGKAEVAKRRNSAISSTIIALLIAGIELVKHYEKPWRLVVFLPLVSAAIGFQQWRSKFCVNFGLRGIFNFKDLGELASVEMEEMRKMDRNRAIKMIVTGIIIAAVLTLLFYLVP